MDYKLREGPLPGELEELGEGRGSGRVLVVFIEHHVVESWVCFKGMRKLFDLNYFAHTDGMWLGSRKGISRSALRKQHPPILAGPWVRVCAPPSYSSHSVHLLCFLAIN
jgi:hypothetical protein